MDRAERYEILQVIARGDFATVSRARDRELAREVAVKQIHEQFLGDPRQLERFWHEAQLLASLQHPHILTIYDISRSRGWLILELMRGSLAQGVAQGPIDLNYLRQVLVQSLQALQFLHANGIVHGDLKPSNLLVDRQNRIKVGDFGLARRAASDEGSLLKGTTKYMAPELITDQFGPVGAASDLYSLGFSAYELLCGPQFESLLPGLDAFGRDRQIAWLMWHAAADRRLPEVHRVLDGVPDDLTAVIEKLIQKDQGKRFQSAEEVLQILQLPPKVGGPTPADDGQQAEAARKQRRRRIIAVTAFTLSLLLSIAMLFSGRGGGGQSVPEITSLEGTVQRVDRSGRKMWVWPSDGGRQQVVPLQKSDTVTISGRASSPGDLQQGDRVFIEAGAERREGKNINRIVAYRPVAMEGQVAEIDLENRRITFQSETGDRPIHIFVSDLITILFNGKESFEKRRITLRDLAPGDRAHVRCVEIQSEWEATELAIDRIVRTEGIVASVDVTENQLIVKAKEGDDILSLSFDDQCRVTVNGLASLQERPFSVADLKPGDEVALEHDSQLVRLDALRTTVEDGTVEGVVEQAHVLSIRRDNDTRVTPFLIDAATTVVLNAEKSSLRQLRRGDRVQVTHQSLDRDRPTARKIAATRPADRHRWAIVVGVGLYHDAALPSLAHIPGDARALATTLTARFQVPQEQCRLLIDPTTLQLKHGIVQSLTEPGPEPGDSVAVYFGGHGFVDDGGKVHLVTVDFDPAHPEGNDTTLQWLIDLLEACPANEKLVLLDCCQAAWSADPNRQPSASEVLTTLVGPRGQAALRTVTVIASTATGQRGRVDPSGSRGLFGYYLNEAYSGDADANRDQRLEVSELFSFLRSRMQAAEATLGARQTPTLALPDNSAPRLSDQAKDAVLKLAALISVRQPESSEIFARYTAAKELCGEEVEPDLLHGLLLMQNRDRDGATRQFQTVLLAHPESLVALQARAWLWCLGVYHVSGPRPEMSLEELVRRIHDPAANATADDRTAILRWAGQIRQFVGLIAESKPAGTEDQLRRLDAVVDELGTVARDGYQEGRQTITALAGQFDKQLAEANDPSVAAQVRMQRSSLKNYVSFPYESAVEMVVGDLDR